MRSTLWFSWSQLALGARIFLLILTSTSIYVVFSAFIVLRRVHSLMNRQPEGASSHQRSMRVLQARCSNIGQLIGTIFYLFGFVFFVVLPGATWVLGDTKVPMVNLMLESFLNDFAYAANVFLVFFVLSLIRWFVSARVRACALHLNTIP